MGILLRMGLRNVNLNLVRFWMISAAIFALVWIATSWNLYSVLPGEQIMYVLRHLLAFTLIELICLATVWWQWGKIQGIQLNLLSEDATKGSNPKQHKTATHRPHEIQQPMVHSITTINEKGRF
ncbi:unnamed protein product [Allacma fusca]|uniref:Uncharacterized protein n=1 Tax=Allacma fusca TaxID=39272 RepID=A0A8J2KB97_9HEXA|nr:unnamed protein product [Allacma fusca]